MKERELTLAEGLCRVAGITRGADAVDYRAVHDARRWVAEGGPMEEEEEEGRDGERERERQRERQRQRGLSSIPAGVGRSVKVKRMCHGSDVTDKLR